jgi:hypothetical protein
MGNKHLLEVGRLYLNTTKKGGKGKKTRKVTERKKVNMHLLEVCKGYTCKGEE